MEFVETYKGKPCVIFDGYAYRKKKATKGGLLTWLCAADKKIKCGARIKTKHDELIASVGEHKCVPDLAGLEVRKATTRARKRARDDTAPVSQIYKEEFESLHNRGYEQVTRLPSLNNIKSCLYMHRNKAQGHKSGPSKSEDIVFGEKTLGIKQQSLSPIQLRLLDQGGEDVERERVVRDAPRSAKPKKACGTLTNDHKPQRDPEPPTATPIPNRSRNEKEELVSALRKKVFTDPQISSENDKDKFFLLWVLSEIKQVPPRNKLTVQANIISAIARGQQQSQSCSTTNAPYNIQTTQLPQTISCNNPESYMGRQIAGPLQLQDQPQARLTNNNWPASEVSHDPLLQLKELVRCWTEDTPMKHFFQEECSRVPVELSSQLKYENDGASRLRDTYQQAATSEGLAAHSEAAGPVDVFPSDGSPAEDPLATNEDSTIHSRLSNTQSQGPILPPQPKQIKIEPCTGHAVSPNSSPHTVGSQGRTSNFQDATLGSQNFTARLHESPPNVHIKSECDYEDDSMDVSSLDNGGVASNTTSETIEEQDSHRTADKRSAKEQDDHDRYGVYVASKLRKMDPVQCVFAENLINQVLFKGAINSLREDTTFGNPSSR